MPLLAYIKIDEPNEALQATVCGLRAKSSILKFKD